jgi:palmitoyltransferase ZDHHC13/17
MVGAGSAPGSPAAPRQPASKSSAAAPKLNSDMEMADMPGSGRQSGDDSKQQQHHHEEEGDIMQLARLGDIPAMEKLFESKGYDATYTDEEGITPLHVGLDLLNHFRPAQWLRPCRHAIDG